MSTLPGTGRITWKVGALYRREVRRKLTGAGLKFTEDKGFLDSQFTLYAPNRRVYDVVLEHLTRWSEAVNKD